MKYIITIIIATVAIMMLSSNKTTYIYKDIQEGDYIEGLGILMPDGCFDLIYK